MDWWRQSPEVLRLGRRPLFGHRASQQRLAECWIQRKEVCIQRPANAHLISAPAYKELVGGLYMKNLWIIYGLWFIYGLYIMDNLWIWLVVFLPLWKIWKSTGMMTFPIYGKIKVMFQTTNQFCVEFKLTRWCPPIHHGCEGGCAWDFRGNHPHPMGSPRLSHSIPTDETSTSPWVFGQNHWPEKVGWSKTEFL